MAIASDDALPEVKRGAVAIQRGLGNKYVTNITTPCKALLDIRYSLLNSNVAHCRYAENSADNSP